MMARFGFYSIGGELVGMVEFDGPMHMEWAFTVLGRLLEYDAITFEVLPKLEPRKLVTSSAFESLIHRGSEKVHCFGLSNVLPRGVMTVRTVKAQEVQEQVYRLLEWVNRVQDFEVSNPRLSADECVQQAYDMIGE